jgi:glycosyltransferase involved in cell wall biosynthesis
MRERPRVCLISSIHTWFNPRLVKEADTLTASGYDVSVIARSTDPWSQAQDDQLLAGRPWKVEQVNLMRRHPSGRARWLLAAARSTLAMQAYRATGMRRFAEEGYFRGLGAVLTAAERTRANFFIAHTQGALPIAARAARSLGVPYGFDCEDLLADEVADGLRDAAIRRAILDIESEYLPGAAYVTVPSLAIADYLAARYAIRPVVVRNVFPQADLREVPPPVRRPPNGGVELVWVSATIGGGRGIEYALVALARLPTTARLTLIGRVAAGFERELATHISELGLETRVTVRPLLPARQLLGTLARFDIGLATEQHTCRNRSLTTTNKLFQYLQAGLLVAATDTPGQREVMASVPRAGILCKPDDPEALAAALQPYINSRERLLEARTAAWHAGIDRYNWERESRTFMAAFNGSDPLAAAV